MTPPPLLYISHKHDDRNIALLIANFVRGLTGGGVDVFLSSEPRFEGPRVGKKLGRELKDALWRAGVVVLVYTTEDNDWSWCMWECGLAEDPKSPDTKVVVIQCLPDRPEVFADSVRVLAWDEDSLVAFARRFRDADFFPGVGTAMTALRPRELEERARELYRDLLKAIKPEIEHQWWSFEYLLVEMPLATADKIESTPREDLKSAVKIALDESYVLEVEEFTAKVFGKARIEHGKTLKKLSEDWRSRHPDGSLEWRDDLAQQIVSSTRDEWPKPEWKRLALDSRSIYDGRVLVVHKVRRMPRRGVMQFDVYFLPVPSLPAEN